MGTGCGVQWDDGLQTFLGNRELFQGFSASFPALNPPLSCRKKTLGVWISVTRGHSCPLTSRLQTFRKAFQSLIKARRGVYISEWSPCSEWETVFMNTDRSLCISGPWSVRLIEKTCSYYRRNPVFRSRNSSPRNSSGVCNSVSYLDWASWVSLVS